MTHGSGSLASAGSSAGGGFSSGTSSAFLAAGSTSAWSLAAGSTSAWSLAAGSTSAWSSTRRRECCVASCCLCCTGLGYLFCLKEMAKSSRIQLAWFWLIVISVVSGLSVGMGTYGADKFPTALTDMRAITDGFSTVFCDAFKVSSSATMDAFLMPNFPKVDLSRRQLFNMTKTMDIPGDSYEYYGFYLLKGSTITVSSCAIFGSTLYVIKGFDNLQTWLDDDSCRGCYLEKMKIPNSLFCTDYTRYNLHTLKSDDYYFVYTGSYIGTRVTGKFYLDRTLYNLTSSLKNCTQKSDCYFEISYLSDETVVYHTSDFSIDDTVEMTRQCSPRVIVYIALFVLPYLSIGLLVTIFIHKKCSDPTDVTGRRAQRRVLPPVQLRNEGPTIRTPLLASIHPRSPILEQPSMSPTEHILPRTSGIPSGAHFSPLPLTNPLCEQSESPPKYEVVIQNSEEAPPSYDDTVNRQDKEYQEDSK